jgi:hypothetical protein
MATPGSTPIHHAVVRLLRAPLGMLPHEGRGGGTPGAGKRDADSRIVTCAKEKVATTVSVGTTGGRM